MWNVKKAFFLLLFSILFLFPTLALGEEDENRTISEVLEEGEVESTPDEETVPLENENDIGMEDRSLFSLFLRLFFALFVVIGIMYALLKWMNKRTRQFQSHQTLQNLGGIPLGQNKSVQLIKVGNRLFVVGVGDSIQLLKEIDSEEEIRALTEQQSSPDGHWKEKGTAMWNRFVQKQSENEPKEEEKRETSFSEVMEKELQEMKEVRKKARQQLKESDS